MKRFVIIAVLMGAAACAEMTPERAADRCEERARKAQGPEVGLTMGVSSQNGAFGGASLGISLDALQGRDPIAVYESCVMNLTGETPIRPARLRDL
jgi:hypothetical protein